MMLISLKNIKKYPLFMITFFLLAGVLVLYLLKTDTEFSDMENRYLTVRPALTAAGIEDHTFMEEFETYTEEQIPFRNVLIKAKAAMERMILKEENNGIALGREGYLFEKVLNVDDQLYENEAYIEKFVGDTDRNISVAIAPNSYEILKQLTPVGFPNIDQGAELVEFNSRLLEYENCTVIDLQKALAGKEDEQVYYRTDHHWTTDGAYYAYQAYCNMTENTSVDITSLTAEQIPDFFGTFYAKYKGFGVKPDVITYYDIPIESLTLSSGDEREQLYDLSKKEVYDKYAVFLYGNDGLCEIRSANAGNGKSLVIFKDSYANCLIPFLTYNYDTITIVDLRYYGDSVEKLLGENNTADILFLYNFSFLNEDRHFYRLTS
ncbi:MAG TPA: DHHW family protein [Lachnospiraceae bacterium]|mgnify:CR=1 FL=1|nr:DHHW family protein [Lachnospiraceae bacterium]